MHLKLQISKPAPLCFDLEVDVWNEIFGNKMSKIAQGIGPQQEQMQNIFHMLNSNDQNSAQWGSKSGHLSMQNSARVLFDF